MPLLPPPLAVCGLRGRTLARRSAAPQALHLPGHRSYPPATEKGPGSYPEARVVARLRPPERLKNPPRRPATRARARAAPRRRRRQSRAAWLASGRGNLQETDARSFRTDGRGHPASHGRLARRRRAKSTLGPTGTAAAEPPGRCRGRHDLVDDAASSTASIGFMTYPSIPASRYRSRSPGIACAVSATIADASPRRARRRGLRQWPRGPTITGISRSITRDRAPRPGARARRATRGHPRPPRLMPSRCRICFATSWFTGWSSATRIPAPSRGAPWRERLGFHRAGSVKRPVSNGHPRSSARCSANSSAMPRVSMTR